MSTIEVTLVIIAISAVATGVAAIVATVRIGVVTRQIEPLVLDVHTAVKRADSIAGDVEHVVRDARRLETYISSVVEGPLGAALALLRGLAAGVTALAQPRPGKSASPDADGSSRAAQPTSVKGGDDHE